MAIKISGCNVIDDNRCLVNISSIDTNTKTAIENAGVGGEGYLRLTTRSISSFCSGDPVYVCCCTPSLAESVVIDPAVACMCLPNFLECGVCLGRDHLSSDKIVTFGCNSNCIAIVHYRGGGFLQGCACYEGCFCVQAVTVTSAGDLGERTCVCSGILCNCSYNLGCVGDTLCSQETIPLHDRIYKQRPYAVESCSGTVSYHVLGFQQNARNTAGQCRCCEVWAQLKLCYCTTTQQISIICLCCCVRTAAYTSIAGGCQCRDQYYWMTPDKCYTIIERPGSTCMSIDTCASRYLCLSVLVNDDNMNLIDHSCCATMVCGPTGGFKAFMNCDPNLFQYWQRCVTRSSCGNMATGGIMRNTYGLDGWIMMHFDVDNTCNVSGCNDILNCSQQKLFAYRPVGHQCYEITCNCFCALCLSAACNICSLPAICSGQCGNTQIDPGVPGLSGQAGIGNEARPGIHRSFDIGNGVKVLVSAYVGDSCCKSGYGYTCFCIDASRNLVYLGSQSTMVGCYCSCLCTFGTGNFGGSKYGITCHADKFNLYNTEEFLLELAIPICRALCCMVWAIGAGSSRHILGRQNPSTQDNLCGNPGDTGSTDPNVSQGIAVWTYNSYSDPSTNFNCICFTCSGQFCSTYINATCSIFIPAALLKCYITCTPPAQQCDCSVDIYSNIHKASDDAYFGITDRSVFSMRAGNGMFFNESCCIGIYKNTFRDSQVFSPNTNLFVGVAQNNAAAGETVCVALPGQLDLSLYATRFQCCTSSRLYCLNSGWLCYIGACATSQQYYPVSTRATTFYDSDRGCYIAMWTHIGC